MQDTKLVVVKYKVRKLFLQFGSNDICNVSNILWPVNKNTNEINDKIVYGTSTPHTNEDPLNIIQSYPSEIIDCYDSFIDDYFYCLDEIIQILAPQQVYIIACMGRYLKGVDSHVGYNRSSYYLRNRIYRRYGEVQRIDDNNNVTIIDLFVNHWCTGTNHLLHHHKMTEIVKCVMQDMYYTQYGGVHYSAAVYGKILDAILDNI